MHMMMKYLQNFQWLEGSTDWKSYQSERGREREWERVLWKGRGRKAEKIETGQKWEKERKR